MPDITTAPINTAPASTDNLVGVTSAGTLFRIPALAVQSGGTTLRFSTWGQLAAVATAGLINGQAAEVVGPDAGTHTDPVAGGTVPNVGAYSYRTGSPAGWLRVGNTSAVIAADAAGTIATSVATSVSRALDDMQVRQPAWAANEHQLRGSEFTNLATRFTSSVVSGALRLQSVLSAIWFLGGLTGLQLTAGRSVRAASTVANASSNSAVAVGFQAAGPAPGAAVAPLDAAFVGLAWRQNGVLVALQRDGAAAASGVTITPTVSAPWVTGDALAMDLAVSDSGAVSVTLSRNGVQVASAAVTGLTLGHYIWTGARVAGSADIHDIQPPEEVTPGPADVPKTIYVTGTGTGTGQLKNLPADLSRALRYAGLDSRRRRLQLVLAGGTTYRGAISITPGRYDAVEIISDGSTPATIMPSVAIASGTNAFTSLGGDVWWIDGRNMLASGSLYQTGATLEQPLGRTGVHKMTGARLWSRLSPNLDSSVISAGGYSAHASGTHAGRILIRMSSGIDPNTLTWEVVTANEAIGWSVGSGDFQNGRLSLAGLNLVGGYRAALWAGRLDLELDNVRTVLATAGAAAQLNSSRGVVRSCQSGWSAGDGWNGAGGLAGASADPNGLPVLRFDGCTGLGHPALTGWSGDCFSNHHDAAQWHLTDCVANGAAKDGVSAGAPIRLSSFRAADAVDSGIKLYGTAGKSWSGLVSTAHIIGCNRGLSCDNVATATVALTASRVHVAGAVEAAFSCVTTGATMTLTDCVRSGSLPSRGWLDDRAGGSAFTAISGVAV